MNHDSKLVFYCYYYDIIYYKQLEWIELNRIESLSISVVVIYQILRTSYTDLWSIEWIESSVHHRIVQWWKWDCIHDDIVLVVLSCVVPLGIDQGGVRRKREILLWRVNYSCGLLVGRYRILFSCCGLVVPWRAVLDCTVHTASYLILSYMQWLLVERADM